MPPFFLFILFLGRLGLLFFLYFQGKREGLWLVCLCRLSLSLKFFFLGGGFRCSELFPVSPIILAGALTPLRDRGSGLQLLRPELLPFLRCMEQDGSVEVSVRPWLFRNGVGRPRLAHIILYRSRVLRFDPPPNTSCQLYVS